MRQYGYEPGPISPEFGIEITNALNAQQGRGRAKKSYLQIFIKFHFFRS